MIPGGRAAPLPGAGTTGGPPRGRIPRGGPTTSTRTNEDPNRIASTAAGRGLLDREQVPTLDTATATATPVTYAAALLAIAQLVDGGLPRPDHVSVDSYGQVVAHVSLNALPSWIIELDVPAPDWEVITIRDQIHRSARWPASVHAERLFRLACADTVPLNPNASTVCRDCSDLNLGPCDPGCRQ